MNDTVQHPGVRAKSMYVEVEREDKYGNRKPMTTKQHITVSAGMFSGKEMEKMAQEQAKELGISEDRIKIETYQNGEAPMEANPRHRGFGNRFKKVGDEAVETTPAKAEIRTRTVFQGITLPNTPEELEVYLAEFEARKAALRGSSNRY